MPYLVSYQGFEILCDTADDVRSLCVTGTQKTKKKDANGRSINLDGSERKEGTWKKWTEEEIQFVRDNINGKITRKELIDSISSERTTASVHTKVKKVRETIKEEGSNEELKNNTTKEVEEILKL